MSEEYRMPPAEAVETLLSELGRAVCTLLENAKNGADEATAKQLQAHLDSIQHFARQAPAGIKWRLEKSAT